jgi:hypothetical protein
MRYRRLFFDFAVSTRILIIAMSSKRHEKPTTPFGFVAFSKDGEVDVSLSKLPPAKVDQEAQVAHIFAQQLPRFFQSAVSDPSRLPERGHDASMKIDGQRVLLQITEICQREFELPPGSLDPGNPNSIGHFSAVSDVAIQLDTIKTNDAIRRAVEKKVNKCYASDRDASTWLLVFTTSPHILTETFLDGKPVIEEPLHRARAFAASRSVDPFSEIWFSNLVTRPVRIWPLASIIP